MWYFIRLRVYKILIGNKRAIIPNLSEVNRRIAQAKIAQKISFWLDMNGGGILAGWLGQNYLVL
jgi:hypothetical protein